MLSKLPIPRFQKWTPRSLVPTVSLLSASWFPRADTTPDSRDRHVTPACQPQPCDSQDWLGDVTWLEMANSNSSWGLWREGHSVSATEGSLKWPQAILPPLTLSLHENKTPSGSSSTERGGAGS